MESINVELAHDLRMPLQVIASCAQLLALELNGRAEAREYLDMLMDSVDHMQRMLGGALESCGRAPRSAAARPENGDLAACVRAVCRRCRPWAEARGVALVFSGVDALRTALDRDALFRVLMNLIANALRFTPPGGRVRVTLVALGDFAEIRVADDGCGIPPERLDRVFLPGETDGGHGLGLPIARRLARGMGGELTAESVPDQGSTFTLRLPVRAAEAG